MFALEILDRHPGHAEAIKCELGSLQTDLVQAESGPEGQFPRFFGRFSWHFAGICLIFLRFRCSKQTSETETAGGGGGMALILGARAGGAERGAAQGCEAARGGLRRGGHEGEGAGEATGAGARRFGAKACIGMTL